MKIFASAVCAGALLVSGSSQAQFSQLRVERVNNQNRVVGTTWRVYAVMQQEGDILDAVYGDKNHPMEISSTAPFYQHPKGGALASQVMRMDIDKDPTLRFDSWFTIGADDNYMNSVTPFIVEFGEFENGNTFITQDGAWFVTPDKRQAMAPENKEILLMQLTSLGKIDGVINLHGRTRGVTDAAGNVVGGNAQIQETGLRFTCDPAAR
jgi:hypothetical protein